MLRRLRHGIWIAALLAGASFGWQARLAAQSEQGQAEKTPSGERATSFQAVSGPVKEDIPGGPLLLGAYAVVWVALFGYVYRMLRLQRGVEDNLERLEHAVAITPARDEVGARPARDDVGARPASGDIGAR